jgi:hypothetical protein
MHRDDPSQLHDLIGFFVLVWASFMGYLPNRLFWPTVGAETLLALFTIRKIHSLRSFTNRGM